MRIDTQEWEIIISPEFRAYWSRLKQKGAYFWKLSPEECAEVNEILCKSYGVVPAKLVIGGEKAIGLLKRYGACGLCCFYPSSITSTVYTYGRPHIKTLVHELYHHIDNIWKYRHNRPKYNSSDKLYNGHKFAEYIWNALHNKQTAPAPTPDPTMRPPISTQPTEQPITRPNIIRANFYSAEIYSDLEQLKNQYYKVGRTLMGWRIPTRVISEARLREVINDPINTFPKSNSKEFQRHCYLTENNKYVLHWREII